MASSRHIHKKFLKNLIQSIFSYFGYQVSKKNNFMLRFKDYIAEASDDEKRNIEEFEKICLASKINLWSIQQSLTHIKNKEIPGDIVECGIYNGFTLAFIERILNQNNIKKKVWGYDTFEQGFIKETVLSKDKIKIKNKDFDITEDKTKYFTKDQVIKNIETNTDFDEEKIKLIKGNILETLNNESNIPEKISFLRMDTDIYMTTKKQLEVLYPRLSKGGVLHIDDYGWMSGVKEAVDEYFSKKKIWLHHVDMTCRYLIKED